MISEAQIDTVEAEVNYLADPPVNNPRRWLQFSIHDKRLENMRLEPHTVSIRNARDIADELDLEREGFRLVTYPSAVQDYRDTAAVMALQPAEYEALICELTGASRAICVGPQLRFAASIADADRSLRGTGGIDTTPAGFVHGDFTDEGIHWMADPLSVRLDDYPRYACYNVWRAISPPPQDIPLAVCDARTVAEGESEEALAVLDSPEFAPRVERMLNEIYRHSPEHRWYYFRDMTADEAIVFKTYDSDLSRVGPVPHTAFTDPSCPSGGTPRSSVEARVIALFDR